MALSDHQVPDEVKNVTLELLQKCVGSICVVKFFRGSLLVTACGMMTELVTPENLTNKDLSEAHIVLFTGLEYHESIQASKIKYIYAPSMVPGVVADLPDIIGPLSVSDIRLG